jgi:hypothetical protein
MAIFSLTSAAEFVGYELGEGETKPALVAIALVLVVS